MHPWDRSQRRFVGEAFLELRPLLTALWARDRELRVSRLRLRETTTTLREWKIRKAKGMAETRPNAPLLKRLVRYPFALHTVAPTKTTVRMPVPWADLHAEQMVYASHEIRKGRDKAAFPNPMTSAEMVRLRTREHRPTLSQWLTTVSTEGDK